MIIYLALKCDSWTFLTPLPLCPNPYHALSPDPTGLEFAASKLERFLRLVPRCGVVSEVVIRIPGWTGQWLA